jgi:hypothetical protein
MRRIIIGLAVLCIPASSLTGIQEDRAVAFCAWAKTQTDMESPIAAEFCQTYRGHDSTWIATELEQISNVWRKTDEFRARLQSFNAYWAPIAKNAEAKDRAAKAEAARRQEEERRAKFVAALPTASDNQLCAEVRKPNGIPEALQEIVRRKTYPAADVSTIATHQIRIGMSEAALFCSWGQADQVNRTVTAAGERKQLIYGRQFVYTDNGVITAFQD